MTTNRNTHIGKIAEAAFRKLCVDAGLIVNGSTEDAAGWDFYIQSELTPKPDTSPDKNDLAFGALVQVKGSSTKKDYVAVKLTNGERMITDPRPAFFALFHIDKDNNIKSAYLAHVGENAISFVLEKLRGLNDLEKVRTHKKTVKIPLKIMDAVPLSHSDDLKSYFSRVTAAGNFHYVQNKIRHFAQTGYTENAFSGSFSLPTDTAAKDIISVMFGESPSINVNDFKVTETRFGIEKEILFSDQAVISIEIISKTQCEVLFTSHDLILQAKFSCELLCPPIPGLDEEDFRVLVRNEYISFQMSKKLGIHKLKFQIINEDKVNWRDLRNIFALNRMSKQGAFTLTCYADGQEIASGRSNRIAQKISSSQYTSVIIKAIDNLYINPQFSYYANFSLREFNESIADIKEYFYLLAEQQDLVLTVNLHSAIEKIEADRRLIFPIIFRANGGYLGILINVSGDISISGLHVEAKHVSVNLLATAFATERTGTINKLKSVVDNVAKTSDNETIIVNEELLNTETRHLLSEHVNK